MNNLILSLFILNKLQSRRTCGSSSILRHLVCTNLYKSIMFFLFAKLGRNSNTVQSELSPIVQWKEFGPSPVTVLLNWNHFQYCVLPFITYLVQIKAFFYDQYDRK
jgi:hypothetical protein